MITKFIEPWVLFPGFLVLVLLFLGVFLWRTGGRARGLLATAEAVRIRRVTARVRAIGGVLIAIAALLYLVSTPAVSRVLLGSLERRVAPPTEIPPDVDAVVVLGGGVVADAPSEALLQRLSPAPEAPRQTAALSPEAESRLIYGLRLARSLDLPIVVTGGRVLSAESVPPEASVARHLLRDLGFPDERILVESASRTTAENAGNTREMFGFSRVIVVTSAYHMPRSIFAFESVGVAAVPAPAAFRTDRRPLRPIDAMPRAGALYNSSVFLREMVGLAYYRLVM
ncbi:MAG: YdcF family protein [Spirochaeta sp.]|nr:YdcF family protein [Spirochaeta sp.]